MNVERLVQLGFNVAGSGEDAEVKAEILLPLMNPLTQAFIDQVAFRFRDGRLHPTAPAEIRGLAPLPVLGMERFADFEAQLHTAFDDAIMKMQRRQSELTALALAPRVDPQTLELSCAVDADDLKLRIAMDKQGQFRVVEAVRDKERLALPPDVRFELSEFRDGRALAAYLEALVTDLVSPEAAPKGAGAPQPSGTEPSGAQPQGAPQRAIPLTLSDLAAQFGGAAMVPQKTPVEIVVDLEVQGARYRFAASRVVGRTFRGLLAGPRGKVWADRFELEEFPGVVTLVAAELNVPTEEVSVVDGAAPRE